MIQHAVAELEKIAVEWTPLKARALEAALGAGGGAALGGLTGSGTYTPKSPVYRIDPQGFLLQRDLSPEEKKERVSRALKAAAGGAALGTAGSLGASKLLRHLQDIAGKEELAYALKHNLPGRKQLLQDMAAAHQEQVDLLRQDLQNPFLWGDRARESLSTMKAEARKVTAARQLLGEEEQRIVNLAERARQYRRARPFGAVPDVVNPHVPPGHPEWRKGKDPRGSLGGQLNAEEVDVDNPAFDASDRQQRIGRLRKFYQTLINERAGG